MPIDSKHRQGAVLFYVVDRHPEHLRPSELARAMAGKQDETEQLTKAIEALKDSDLLRETDGIIEPTPAGLHAASILTL
jgi:hypothetical protein